MVWLPEGKKFEEVFIRFRTTNERDRRTDRQHAPMAYAVHKHSIVRQKWSCNICQVDFLAAGIKLHLV